MRDEKAWNNAMREIEEDERKSIIAADRAALVRAVMGMAFVGITGDREDGYNDALEDVVDLLHSPEKK